jgi:hypothetical protein
VIHRIDKLPTVVTSFGYRTEYVNELEGLIPTVHEHHPDWPIVAGRGPVTDFEMPTLEVDSPAGKYHWSLPVPLDLESSIEASERDWAKIALMKPWWIAEVWHNLQKFLPTPVKRLIWLDADSRLNGPLDIELEPDAEIVAGPWWPGQDWWPQEHICGGFLLFQGRTGGIVETIVSQWSQQCNRYIQHLPPAPPPGQRGTVRDDDQKVLTDLLKRAAGSDLLLLKLDWQKYCGVPDDQTGLPPKDALIDQWMMNEKMRYPENRGLDWPPPEEKRRARPMKGAV